MRVDGGQRHRADPLEVARGGPEPPLDAEVEDGEREEEEADKGQGVDGDDDGADHAEEVGEENVQDEGQAVVHCVQITGKPEENKDLSYMRDSIKIGTVFVFSTDNTRRFGYRYCPYTIHCKQIRIVIDICLTPCRHVWIRIRHYLYESGSFHYQAKKLGKPWFLLFL